MKLNLGSVTTVSKMNSGRCLLLAAALQSAAYAQAKPTGLAAYESLFTSGFFVLLATFVGLVVWEVVDGKKASRSSLDIAKLAAAAAKKQSAAGAPSGSLAALEAPPTTRPFAPPPPPPPPKQPVAASESSMEQPSPFAPPAPREEAVNPFSPPPSEMIGASGSPNSLESTVAFNPTGGDAGSSGGWADLLQRVRAGEPEAASFQDTSPTPLTEDESFSLPQSAEPVGGVSPASSSEAWEALLKRTTTGEQKGPAKLPTTDIGKISLNANFQLPGENAPAAPAASPFALGGTPFGMPSSEDDAPTQNVFGSSFDEGATFPAAGPPSFPVPSSSLPPAEPKMDGFSFSSDPTTETSSPFSMTPPASGSFEAPSFKLPSSPSDDFGGGGSGGFQLPGAGGGVGAFGGAPVPAAANPFDFSGGGGGEGGSNPSSSTMALSDLFNKPGASSPPSFQLPTGAGGGASPMDFSSGGDSDPGAAGLGRTISLDFAKGGGQKPPPPLPKTEG